MDRKDFLKQLWNRLIIPIIIVITLYFCVKFLISVFNENGSERHLTIIILSLTIVLTLVYLIGKLFSKIKYRIYAKLSDKVKFKLRIISKTIDYLALLVLGAVLYKSWTKHSIMASIVFAILLVDRINKIVKEEKSKVIE